jgi:hypothetical protein
MFCFRYIYDLKKLGGWTGGEEGRTVDLSRGTYFEEGI